ncbi:MAG: hypothetical protein V7695_17620 [Sulfitobacter sp.]
MSFLSVIIGLMTLIEATIVYILAVVFLHLVVLRQDDVACSYGS